LSETTSYIAHHFDDAEQQHEASTLGMWLFLVTEIMFFGGVFTCYIVYRSAYPSVFAHASNHLDVLLGTINTGVLITSSLTMALAVHGAQIGKSDMLKTGLLLTILLGSVFLAIKAYEYGHKFHEGLVPGPYFTYAAADAKNAELFFSMYFAMTGLHALHMVIGITILCILLFQARRGMYGPHYSTPIEMTGLYWHFVDIVWIYLFPLLYLVGRH
jgi:cytochrome c oxidase subunit III